MSPHAPHMETLWSVAVLAVLLVTTLGLITCVVSHYKGTVRPCHPPAPATPITTPMLALQAGMERDLGAQRDRQIRLHSVHTDLELDLPPSIALPDGEEIPYGSSTRLHIRDSEQESEIYQKCIRAPPNRTVFDGESPPPYRSSSAGLLSLSSATSSSSSSSGEWTTSVVRCHSMSSRYPPPSHLPAVIVPTRQRLSSTPLAVVPLPHHKPPPRPL
ncbi:protein TMEPAI-like [Homalodisca vitripennis]|uniref:protein TMEPAI-like n=1 Tax=Homalodisca vitripennis TaxID=197043 RepID=UPI001EECA831|nr:protein TMEPAI-like [Homalodisca vitripennis]